MAVVRTTLMQGPSAMQITTIGLDLAKSVFQVHCLDSAGGAIRKKLRRSEVLGFFRSLQPCLVGMESCATAWARRDKNARVRSGRLFMKRSPE